MARARSAELGLVALKAAQAGLQQAGEIYATAVEDRLGAGLKMGIRLVAYDDREGRHRAPVAGTRR